jgi:NAD(P)-dependent dehydrogenase (short-subunit alcohol dehydrogenase family)
MAGTAHQIDREAEMQGKVVVITGATSGIGKVAAERLAAMGARLVLVARDPQRGEALLAELRRLGPGNKHSAHYADLSRLAETKRVAAEIAAAEPRIDVLINNAGAIFTSRQVTEDGLERTFALNHMSYFLVTLGLRRSLAAAAPARVVNTASNAHQRGRLDFDDLQTTRGYRAFRTYGTSKLCNILFTRELARRGSADGITTNSLHPGFVDTRFGDQGRGWLNYGIKIGKLFALSPQKGAETIVYLASSPEVARATGGYYYKCALATPTRAAQDDSAAKRLWVESARLAGIQSD